MRKDVVPTEIDPTHGPLVQGILELHHKGYGFLRAPIQNLSRSKSDPFLPAALITKLALKQGSTIVGQFRPGPKGHSAKLTRVVTVDGMTPTQRVTFTPFDELRAVNPSRPLTLESLAHDAGDTVSTRVLDLFCPIGRGQRALIAAPPRAGKTTMLRQVTQSIAANHPDVVIKLLLIDERPEEVTEMRDQGLGDVFASNLDHTPRSHARLSRLVIDHCQRIVETGKDVFLVVDSLTRMARACNKLRQDGPIGPGGLNIHALELPKHVFSSARATDGGGSLTVLASILTETGNRMDDVIFREFKGTGNCDIVLDQSIADQRIWPAIDIKQSATRRIELLQDPETMATAASIRSTMMGMSEVGAMRELTSRLGKFPTNRAFLDTLREKLQSLAN